MLILGAPNSRWLICQWQRRTNVMITQTLWDFFIMNDHHELSTINTQHVFEVVIIVCIFYIYCCMVNSDKLSLWSSHYNARSTPPAAKHHAMNAANNHKITLEAAITMRVATFQWQNTMARAHRHARNATPKTGSRRPSQKITILQRCLKGF